MLPDPNQTILKNDTALLANIFAKLLSKEGLLSLRFAAKKDSLILYSSSHRFLSTFCKKAGFETIAVDENYNTTTKFRKDPKVSRDRLFKYCQSLRYYTKAAGHSTHIHGLLSSDWMLLSEMLETFNSQDSLLSICYEETIDSLEIKSRCRHFLYPIYNEHWLAKGSGEKKQSIANHMNITSVSNKPQQKHAGATKKSNCNLIKEPDKHIKALLTNDSSAIEEIYDTFAPSINQMVIQKNGTIDDAKDIIQDTMVSMLEKARAGKLKKVKDFGGYFYTTCTNKYYNHYKKTRLIVSQELSDHSSNGFSENPFQQAEELEQEQKLFKPIGEGFEKLGPLAQAVLMLWLRKVPFDQMALQLNISPGFARKYKCEMTKRLGKLVIASPEFGN